MESLSGTVEGLLQGGSSNFECTPPLADLSPEAQALLFQGSWLAGISQVFSQEEGSAVIEVENSMTLEEAEAPSALLEGNPLVSDSMEVGLLNLDSLGHIEPPIKREELAATLSMGPPATNVYEGNYGFDVRCPNRDKKSTKSINWTYSEHWRKLYATMNTACPFDIHVDKKPPPGTVVRVMAVYAEPEDRMEVIKRCVLHASPENNQGDASALASHFVRCDSSKAEYHQDPETNRHSLTVLYEEPQAGLNVMQCLLRFMCRSSCASTMRRRAVKLIWTLEHGGQVLGRQSIDLKVCACPGRDRSSEERAATKQRGSAILDLPAVIEPAIHHTATTSYGQPVRRKRVLMEGQHSAFTGGPSKSRKVEPEEERPYFLECSSREIYDQLKLIRDGFMALKLTNPALFRAHLRKTLGTHERGTTVKQEPGETVSSGESQE